MTIRNNHRMRFSCQLTVVDRITDQIVGQVADLTPEGMMICGENKIDTNRNLYLSIELPEEIMGRTSIHVSALSHWWKKADTSGIYCAGLTLKNLDKQDVEIIQWLSDKYGTPV